MAMTQAEIQRRSDEKRGVRVKSFKLPIAVINLIEETAQRTGKPQTLVISEAIRAYTARSVER
ncbi:hypothetical protein [Stenoxybacter acetivorans]|uniref:hypothetical protein n=1 Tax=Stenoxybacter acetivorans TaxID=422441 RepID=UPI0005665815|nr:hypothetical protein [Stenoxybacter acetivorans]